VHVNNSKSINGVSQNYDLRPRQHDRQLPLMLVILWTAILLLAFCTNTLIGIFTLFYVCVLLFLLLSVYDGGRCVLSLLNKDMMMMMMTTIKDLQS